jgi:CRP-like cAMP-binding protein
MLSTVEKVILLKKVPVFENLGGEELLSISDIAIEQDFKPDQIIFREGSYGYELYIIASGNVEISKKSETAVDKKKVITTLHQFDYFGEMSLFEDAPRSATITALEKVHCLIIAKEAFLDICMEYPAIALEIITTFSKRLRSTTTQLT